MKDEEHILSNFEYTDVIIMGLGIANMDTSYLTEDGFKNETGES